jgi:hypothetical protein
MSLAWIDEWIAWWDSVPTEFAFLLALPLIVAAAGLWADRPRARRIRKAGSRLAS